MQNGVTTGLLEGPFWPGNHRSPRKSRSQDGEDIQPGWGISGESRALSWTPSCLSVPPLFDLHGPCLRGGRRREGEGRKGGRLSRQGDSQQPAQSSLGRGGKVVVMVVGAAEAGHQPPGWLAGRLGGDTGVPAVPPGQWLAGEAPPAFLRCSREPRVEVRRGVLEPADRATQPLTGAASAEEAGMGCWGQVGAERSCESFSKALGWEGCLEL